MQYSIWLLPSSPTYEHLKEMIHSLAMEHQAPMFEPHITLLGNVEIDLNHLIDSIRQLSMNVHSFQLVLGDTSFSSTYFQSVLVRVQASSTLMQLHVDLKNALKVETSPFMPHISLLYGDFDMKMREIIASKIHFPQTVFEVNKFVITPATSNPSEWNHLATIPFNQ